MREMPRSDKGANGLNAAMNAIHRQSPHRPHRSAMAAGHGANRTPPGPIAPPPPLELPNALHDAHIENDTLHISTHCVHTSSDPVAPSKHDFHVAIDALEIAMHPLQSSHDPAYEAIDALEIAMHPLQIVIDALSITIHALEITMCAGMTRISLDRSRSSTRTP